MKSLDKLLELCDPKDQERPNWCTEYDRATDPKRIRALVTSLQEAIKALDDFAFELPELPASEAKEALAKIHETLGGLE